MNKKLLFLILLVLPVVVIAAGGGAENGYFAKTGRDSDFIPRVFNFLIYAGLIYYLLSSPIKGFFVSRREGIEAQLNELEAKLKEAREAEIDAKQALLESEIKFKEIVEDSKKEAELLIERLEKNIQRDLEAMQRLFDEKKDYELRRMIKDTIGEVLNENITSDDIPLSENQVIEIISKKVA